MIHRYSRCVVFAAAFIAAIPALAQSAPPPNPLQGLEYDTPFFPGANYNANVPTPDSVLGFPVGSKAATHAQIEAVVKAIAAKSPRAKLFEYGRTHEGRALYYLVLASESNIQRLDALKADLARLADPRMGKSASEIDKLADTLPAVAWMAYCIHGNEMSGSDAALAVAHHLAASTDKDVKDLLDRVVVIIDPLMNPDGRDRCITSINEARTLQPQVDDQALLHTGVWPSGRMNHYLFDMNRDWIFATQPETRGRIAAVRQWSPHYFMESHEMGPQDTFLFMPATEAFNPNHPANAAKWEQRFARDLANAFDARGWRYYTGEWNDNWYPGYSSSWASLGGMIQNLYEQASGMADGVRRADGSIEPYREGVHKQLVSTMTNLNFLAANRKEILADFLAQNRRYVSDEGPNASRVFAVLPSGNLTRLGRFLDLMRIQGFEAFIVTQPFTASGKDRLGRAVTDREFPAGTILIPNRQPLSPLVSAMLEFDPRMKDSYITDERRELLRFNRTKIYDITGWSLPMLFDVDAYELTDVAALPGDAKPMPAPAPPTPAIVNPDTTVAFILDGSDDACLIAAARLMEMGIWCRAAAKPFEFDTGDTVRAFPRGSIIVTRKENAQFTGDLVKSISDACAAARVTAIGVKTGMGIGDLPDLGGEHFILLQPPRVALFGREPFEPYSYGQAWYAIDHTLGLRASYIDFHNFEYADLRRYNVLILPDGGGDEIAEKLETLKPWVESGGTLIAIGSSAAALATEKGIGSTRLLQDVLDKPEPYIQSVIREWVGVSETPDPARVWSFSPPGGDSAIEYPWDGADGGEEKPDEDELKRRDEWRRIFSPSGVILAARVDDRSWLTAGCDDRAGYLPVMHAGDQAFVTPPGISAPVRLGLFNPVELTAEAQSSAEKASNEIESQRSAAPSALLGASAVKLSEEKEKPKPGWTIAPPGHELRLRMSGLLWPEAAERLANTAYVTRESIGSGQIILFSSDPNFRAATLGTSRIFQNAVLYGPGMGASQPITP